MNLRLLLLYPDYYYYFNLLFRYILRKLSRVFLPMETAINVGVVAILQIKN